MAKRLFVMKGICIPLRILDLWNYHAYPCTMNSLADAILLILGFGSLALAGQWLFNRFFKQEILEHHHSAGEAMMGVVGTLFSVLLGFMIASAMERYDNRQ